MSEEMNTSNKFNFFGVELPKIEMPKVELPKIEMPKVELPKIEMPKVELPKIEMPKVELPKIEMPAVNMDGVGTAIDAVKSAAKGSYTTATEAATKVRHSAGQTVTLVREAIGV